MTETRAKLQLARTTRGLLYIAAFLIPPVLTAIILTISTVSEVMIHRNPEPLNEGPPRPGEVISNALPASPVINPNKPTVVILMSNAGTELTDFMAPYEIFSTAGAFNVVTAAPFREVSSTTGALAVLPHFDLKTVPHADVIVIPAVMDPDNQTLTTWIKENAPKAKLVLSICEGARLAGNSGILGTHQVLTHFAAREELKKQFPSATFATGLRYIESEPRPGEVGNLISTAGVTASIDGSLFALGKIVGTKTSLETARKLNIPVRPQNDQDRSLGPRTYLNLVLRAAFDWNKPDVGIFLFQGVSEIGLAAALETYSRSFDAHAKSFSTTRGFLKTENGLDVIAEHGLGESGVPDLMIIPPSGPSGTPSTDPNIKKLADWAVSQKVQYRDWSKELPGSAFDLNLLTLSQLKDPVISSIVGTMIEYPGAPNPLSLDSLGTWLWIRILLLGLLGLTVGRLLMKRFLA